MYGNEIKFILETIAFDKHWSPERIIVTDESVAFKGKLKLILGKVLYELVICSCK